MTKSPNWPIGVFTSLDAGLGLKLDMLRDLGATTIQLHAPRRPLRTAKQADEILAKLNVLGIALTAVFGGFEGESYADIPTVARTVGLVPRETRAARLAEMREISDFAKSLRCSVVGLHLGFITHGSGDALYGEMLNVTRNLCDHCRGNGQWLHLETGQEPADVLKAFIADVQRNNLAINFDPANMILYGVGEPLAALKLLGPLVRSVHCKDATWSAQPGVTWGRETPLGEGDVGMEAFLRTLDKIGYTGPLTIERERSSDPERQRAEIARAIQLLESLKRKLFG